MSSLKQSLILLTLLSMVLPTGCAGDAQSGNAMDNHTMYQGNAPEFPKNMEWLNTDHPLSLKELHGKIVLLDFWTYCCINCMHIIPDLKKLEHKYTDELVVIGVHSAKFLTEQGTDNIRQAILRYDLEHPVVNDKDFKIWKSYGAQGWPTLVLIDPDGNIATRRSGENIYDDMNRQIAKLVQKFAGRIDTTHMNFALEKNKSPITFLRFPGKVTADATNNRLYITDSNNNRIVITDLNGKLLDTIGSDKAGQTDGSFDTAEFFHPQGTVLDGDVLYIADTENHLIRMADLSDKTVSTIAGVGKQVYVREPDGMARETGLNSPWDLTLANNTLYIAMAGSHQLWQIDLRDKHIRLFAGNGTENIVDGSRHVAELAQPSGVTTDGEEIYFADSEVSAVRRANISDNGRVHTIIGHGLFKFGDVDGNYRTARFQHPLGIVYVNGMLYVADTYNNKIKKVDPKKRTSKTYAGTGKPGMQDGTLSEATFDEPGGIAYANGKLYVADTNNHLIRVIDMQSKTVSTLKISNIGEKKEMQAFHPGDYNGKIQSAGMTDFSSLDSIRLKIELPKDYKLNPLAESAIHLFTPDGSFNRSWKLEFTTLTKPVMAGMQADTLYAELLLYYCREDNEGLCYIDNPLLEIKNDKMQTSEKETFTLNYHVSME